MAQAWKALRSELGHRTAPNVVEWSIREEEDTDLVDSRLLCVTTSDTQLENIAQNVFPRHILQRPV